VHLEEDEVALGDETATGLAQQRVAEKCDFHEMREEENAFSKSHNHFQLLSKEPLDLSWLLQIYLLSL